MEEQFNEQHERILGIVLHDFFKLSFVILFLAEYR